MLRDRQGERVGKKGGGERIGVVGKKWGEKYNVIITCRYYSSLYSDGHVWGNSLSSVCPG